MKGRKIRECCTLCMCVLLLISFTVSSEAYNLVGAKLNLPSGTSSSLLFIPYEGFGSTTILHFNHACYPWNTAAGYKLVARAPNITHGRTNYPTKNSVSEIYRVAVNTGASNDDYVAYTIRYLKDSTITEADINLNVKYKWANSAQVGCYDVWSVFMHELGHAVGIGHSGLASAVMYKTVYTNTTKRELTQDDKNAVYANYH